MANTIPTNVVTYAYYPTITIASVGGTYWGSQATNWHWIDPAMHQPSNAYIPAKWDKSFHEFYCKLVESKCPENSNETQLVFKAGCKRCDTITETKMDHRFLRVTPFTYSKTYQTNIIKPNDSASILISEIKKSNETLMEMHKVIDKAYG